MYFGISWYDHRLAWNKTDFNVSEITLSGKDIWIPDFRDAGLGDGEIIEDIRDEIFVVHNDGHVVGQVRRKHKSFCSVHPQYYPYGRGERFGLKTFESKVGGPKPCADNDKP